jgi:hypothetical protein
MYVWSIGMIVLRSTKALVFTCALVVMTPATANARDASGSGQEALSERASPSERYAAPSFAIAPRTIGVTFGSNYFDRSANAGPPQRGRAYNVRRKDS